MFVVAPLFALPRSHSGFRSQFFVPFLTAMPGIPQQEGRQYCCPPLRPLCSGHLVGNPKTLLPHQKRSGNVLYHVCFLEMILLEHLTASPCGQGCYKPLTQSGRRLTTQIFCQQSCISCRFAKWSRRYPLTAQLRAGSGSQFRQPFFCPASSSSSFSDGSPLFRGKLLCAHYPSLLPPSFPRATAAGFLPGTAGSSSSTAWPVAISTSSFASWLTSLGRLLERVGIPYLVPNWRAGQGKSYPQDMSLIDKEARADRSLSRSPAS